MKILVLLFLAIGTTAFGQITDVAGQNELFEFIQKADEVTLYSIDPNPVEKPADDKAKGGPELLHGFVVFGKIEGKPDLLREKIRMILVSAVVSPQPAYECFSPRVAVTLVNKGKRLDILLCYQCHQSRFYYDDQWDEGPLGDSGEAEFNALLDARGIKRDRPKPHAAPEEK